MIGSGIAQTSNLIKHKRLGINPLPKKTGIKQEAAMLS